MKKSLLFAILLLSTAALFAQTPASTRESKVLTIKYLYASNLSQAAPDSISEYNVGDHYCVISPEIVGFTPDKTSVEGDMPNHDIIDTVLYSPNHCCVTILVEPSESGTTTGSGTYDYGTEVNVTASANEGFVFEKWMKGDDQVSTNSEYIFTITEDVTLTAHFSAQPAETYTITATAEPAEGGEVSGAGTFDEGATCTLTASANEGFGFVNWTENGTVVSAEPSYQITVDANHSFVAHFAQNSHTVSVNPNIINGTVTVSPEGEVAIGSQVTITATPDANYSLETVSAYNKDDVSQEVTITGNQFTMPDFDVMVSATFSLNLPTIEGDVEAPAAICAGEALDLTAPNVINAEHVVWQMAATAEFINPVTYEEGQTLDGSYNGWKLRLMASNAAGEVYSNVVGIVVNDMSDLTLVGESSICSGLEAQYEVVGTGNFNLEWATTDANASITPVGNTAKIKWGTLGNNTVTVVVEDQQSGCTTMLEMVVRVQSFVNDADVNSIVAKKQNGKPYMLIYPNPKDDYRYQWYKDGEAIDGANEQYYYPTEGLTPGNYQVYISFNVDADGNLFCGAFSPVFAVNDATFAVFPNPASAGEQIIVLTDCDSEAAITIYNMVGQLVHKQLSQGYETKIDKPLAQGVYVIRITNGSIEKEEKIIVR